MSQKNSLPWQRKMNISSIYPYTSGNKIQKINIYNYSPYFGEDFLNAWHNNREEVLNNNESIACKYFNTDTELKLKKLTHSLQKCKTVTDASPYLEKLDLYVKKFEVSKRLFDEYDKNLKPLNRFKHNNPGNYISLAEALVSGFEITQSLVYLNALIKLNDTISSISTDLYFSMKNEHKKILLKERSFVSELKKRLATKTPSYDNFSYDNLMITRGLGKLKGVGLLAADTVRSRVYLQMMLHFNYKPEFVIFMGKESLFEDIEQKFIQNFTGVGPINLNVKITDTCKLADIPVTHLPDADVNSAAVYNEIKSCGAQILIYSGLSGQIVEKKLLDQIPFIHMHSGWLPRYRGSTTIYYSILERENPSVSAIILNKNIDTGSIVHRRMFPRPTANLNIDFEYDSIIRAYTLLEVLSDYVKNEELRVIYDQTKTEGRDYYIIHPLLKHLALLSL